MANYTGTVIGKGRAFTDAVDALHTNQQLVSVAKRGVMNALTDGANAIDGLSIHTDKTITGTWTFFTGANPSMSVSVTT